GARYLCPVARATPAAHLAARIRASDASSAAPGTAPRGHSASLTLQRRPRRADGDRQQTHAGGQPTAAAGSAHPGSTRATAAGRAVTALPAPILRRLAFHP